MSGWKLSIRNKVEDSKVEEPVKALTASEDESLRGIAQQVSVARQFDLYWLSLFSYLNTGRLSNYPTRSHESQRLPM
jgi:hypothetical protein